MVRKRRWRWRWAVTLPLMVLGLLSAMVVAAPSARAVAGFGDVQADGFYTPAVQWMVDNDIVEDWLDVCFNPYGGVERGRAAEFIWRMEGAPVPGAPHGFTDVPERISDAVAWMVEQGVTEGTTATTFSPERGLNRAELLTFLWRLADSPAPSSTAHPFTDIVPDAFYYRAVLWAVEQGITLGTTATTFSPGDAVTRGQVAAFLYRYQGEPPVVVDPASPGCGSSPFGMNGHWFRRNATAPRVERLRCVTRVPDVHCDYSAFADDILDDPIATGAFNGRNVVLGTSDPVCTGYRGGFCHVANAVAEGTTTWDPAAHALLAVRLGNVQLDLWYDTLATTCVWSPRVTDTPPCETTS